MKIRPFSYRDVTCLLSRHFSQRFAHRFRSSLSAWLESFRKKKYLLTVYDGLQQYTRKKTKTAKNSARERFVSLTDGDVERFVKAEANKNAQRKMHKDVVLMKSFLPNENETRQLQDIPPPEFFTFSLADFYCL